MRPGTVGEGAGSEKGWKGREEKGIWGRGVDYCVGYQTVWGGASTNPKYGLKCLAGLGIDHHLG